MIGTSESGLQPSITRGWLWPAKLVTISGFGGKESALC